MQKAKLSAKKIAKKYLEETNSSKVDVRSLKKKLIYVVYEQKRNLFTITIP